MIFSYLAKPEKPSWPGPPFQMFRFIESPQLEVFEGISTTFPHRCWLDCSNDCNCWCCCTYTHYVLHTWHSKSLIIGMTKVQKKIPIQIEKNHIPRLLGSWYCEDLLEEKSRKYVVLGIFHQSPYCKNHVNRGPESQGAAVV